MGKKRGRKPRRKLPGITLVWSGGWKWRAVVRVDGKQERGTVRESQEDAHADYLILRDGGVPKGEQDAVGGITLGDALDLTIEDARERSLSPHTIEGTYRSHVRFLKAQMNPDVALKEYDEKDVARLIRFWLSKERSPVTIRDKDLYVLSKAFRLAGLPDPVKPAMERMRAALAGANARPRMPFFSAEEVRTILHRIRHEEFFNSKGKPCVYRDRLRHADIFEIIACSGIRAEEFARLRVQDVSFDPLELSVRSKDKANPRAQPVAPTAEAALRRLVASAKDGVLLHEGRKVLNNAGINWQRRLGIKGLHARALRHSYATILLDAGVSLATVGELLGHRKVSTTARYIHAISTRRREAADLLAQHLRPLPGTSDPKDGDEDE